MPSIHHVKWSALVVSLVLSSPAPSAWAQAPLDRAAGPAPAAEERPVWRPFLFSSDAVTLAPGRVALESGAGYNGVLQPGTLLGGDGRRFDTWLTASVGLTERMDLAATALMSETPGRGFGFGEGRVELRARVVDLHRWFPVAVMIGGGYQSDGSFQSAFEGMVAAVLEYQRLSVVVNLRGIHYFHDGRDPLDLYVTAAASLRATDWLRVGAEYVGEELEEQGTGALATDGGSRHYVGPSAATWLGRGRVRLNLTGGVVIASVGNGPMVRGSIAYLF